ncbi:uncharacterized protein LOC122265445 [Penaeus japonicus]|uniref:uncharacterized protein LOC122265445 n=1 Tax=Penaeus japonicus TaxID=27405 RepID=UPI001C711852|nr:uncharacterized protein LOC122265445 [Penaeus japonicus]
MTLQGSTARYSFVVIIFICMASKIEINAQIDVITEVNVAMDNMTLLDMKDNAMSSNSTAGGLRIGDECCRSLEANPCSVEGAECVNCTCVCETQIYNETDSGECKGGSISGSNVKEGALPLEFCAKKDDCIKGLECNDSVCACPHPCEFVSARMICDCGDQAFPLEPVLLGTGLGFLIVGFWIRMIMITLSRHEASRKRQQRQPGRIRQVPRVAPKQAAYGTTPPTAFGNPQGVDSNTFGYPAPPGFPPQQLARNPFGQTSFPQDFPPPYTSSSLPLYPSYPIPSYSTLPNTAYSPPDEDKRRTW